MKPIKFEGCNVCYAENQPQYIPLPAHKDSDGLVETKWQGTLRERVKFLFTGKISVLMLTFNKPLQPLKLEV